jgi:hypothetical protein
VRWWKSFREDADRPAFQAGIERFGTCFVHDLARVWQALCVEEGPGIRKLALTPEMTAMFAHQFRVESRDEALARIEFMAHVGLIDLRGTEGQKIITSSELKRRRDEWSRRKSRADKKKDPDPAPESLLSGSRETPEQSQSQSQKQSQKQSTHVNDVNSGDGNNVTGLVWSCCLKAKDVWEFVGIDFERVPRKFKTKAFVALAQRAYDEFRSTAHEDGECECYPDDLLGMIRDQCKDEGVEYPPALLARQIEIERRRRAS